MLGRNDRETELCVERHVPRHVTEGRQRDRPVPVNCGPLADSQDQPRSEATAAMFGMNIDLFEMYSVGLNHLDVRKPDRNIAGQGDPETSVTLSLLQNVQARRLVQDGLGRVSLEKPRGCQLNC